jgi:hypothetical protein
MAILFDTVSARAQFRARSGVEVLSRLIAGIETFDGSIDGVAVNGFKERP